ncbi:Methionine aminopeptidase 2 [Hondaea fermentalgiana]|uniref:Methionine aminopeptidase 2 n=1 Tax=Hondaea fermentalgiana TaxID=2315210 RepID=A0A2R5G4F7_9STRA|nr:Methionine aminopeptidase 2 [Hondaea fermentalgiana]|eukprot:GBG25906.1 Methionine aminopeptidase 2 [Hondaea fermentalgiana]
MADMEVEEQEVVENLMNQEVSTKFQTAAEIVNKTLTGLLGYADEGKTALEICKFGDLLITQQCSMVFKAKKIEKGIAFPTCVSVNECVCHYSPLQSDGAIPVLKAGDVVKVDLGVHIDGFPVVVAHTFVVAPKGGSPSAIDGKKADVIAAAYTAAEAAVKCIRDGEPNDKITETIKMVSEDFGVKPVQGVLMHQMKRFVIDGNDVVIGREELDQKVESFNFEKGGVYTVDVVMSTGEGKPIQKEARTTVFKRAADQKYMLKMKASRQVMSTIDKEYTTFPFGIGSFKDEKTARMGVVECIKHDLLHPYPVLFEKPGEIVAHFKYTVLLFGSGPSKVTGAAVDPSQLQTEKKPREEVQALLALEVKKNKKNKKKSGAASANAANPPAAPDAMETSD